MPKKLHDLSFMIPEVRQRYVLTDFRDHGLGIPG